MCRTAKTLTAVGALAGALGFGIACAGTTLAVAEDTPQAQPKAEQASAQAAHPLASDEEMKGRWGVEIVALRRTAHGHMLDFRYRVLDAEKAAALFKRQTKPRLIHQATGKVLAVPSTAKVGPLRNSNLPKQGRIYWMFFGNAGNLVKAGDKVTVAIGDFRSENLTVE